MKFVGITKRWFLNVASIVIVILVTVSAALFLSMRNYYYGLADMTLDSYSADEIASNFNFFSDAASETRSMLFIVAEVVTAVFFLLWNFWPKKFKDCPTTTDNE